MTERDVKQWLNRAHNIDKEINNLILERDRAFSKATSAVNGASGEKVQTSAQNSTESKYIAYAEYESEIDRRIDELYEVKKEILRAIKKVENGTYRLLLTLRYIRFMTWEQVAEEMNYSTMHIHRLHNDSLKKVKDVIECYTVSMI